MIKSGIAKYLWVTHLTTRLTIIKNLEGVGAVQYQGYREASTLIGCRVDRILATGGAQHES